MKRHLVWLASLGHLVTDVNQGVVPALLPYFIAQYHLTYAAAAFLVSALGIASTVIQPVFGYYADRFSKHWLLPVGVILAGYGVALSGIVPTYKLSVLFVLITGVGVAAYHPEAARVVHYASGEKKATGMGIFGVGGSVGFSIGPPIAIAVVAAWGLGGTLFLAVPVTLMALIFGFVLSRSSLPQISQRERDPGIAATALRDEWIPFIFLAATVICRSTIFYGLNTFIPLYWINVLHQSKAAGGTALTIMFASGLIGTLAGGRFADLHDHRSVVRVAFAAPIPLLMLLLWIDNVVLANMILAPIGFLFFSGYSPLVVLGQKYLPSRVGFASGITLGVGVAAGGIIMPFLGRIADLHGLPTALTVVACIPIIGLILAFTLPRPQSN